MIESVVTLDASTCSVDAVQRAVYRMSDRLSCDLAIEAGTIRCTLYTQLDNPDQLPSLISDFRNEVLDETLRSRIRDETREVRNLILALAFSNTGLVDPEDA